MLIKLKLEAINKKCLFLYIFFLTKIFLLYNYKYNITFLPIKKKSIIFLKSPHVFKKSKEHFELKKYTILLTLFIHQNNLIYFKSLLINKPTTIKAKITTLKRMI